MSVAPEVEPAAGLVVAIDGNSLLHRAYHSQAGTGLRTADGRPVWAIRGLIGQLIEAVDRLQPSQVIIGFDDPALSYRRDRWPTYKAQRTEKPETLVSQLALAAELLRELGVPVVCPAGLEADDVLAEVATAACAGGTTAVLMTSDRDAFALISDRVSVLRILSGGVEGSPLLTPQRLHLMLGIHPHQYRDYAALRGDASDNLPGVRGIGPKTASRLLAAVGSAAAAFDDVDTGGKVVMDAVGRGAAGRLGEPAARTAWELNCQVMAPMPGVTLPSGSPFPLAAAAVRRMCALLQMPATLPRALRVLAQHDDAAAPAVTWTDAARWADDNRWSDRGAARFPPLPRVRAKADQLALFSLSSGAATVS